MSKNECKHPKGYWMSVGISIGVAIGVAMGPIFDNFGVGVAIGSGIGASLEQKNKDNIRPLTEQEQKRQKLGIVIGLALFFVFYNYTAYVFAMPLNWVSLLHVILMMLSAYALIAPVASIDGKAVQQRLSGSVPERFAGGILLWKRKEFGYVTGLGLLFQGSMLFVALIISLLLQPLLTSAPFAIADVIAIAVMGLVCFIPFGMFVRRAIKAHSARNK